MTGRKRRVPVTALPLTALLLAAVALGTAADEGSERETRSTISPAAVPALTSYGIDAAHSTVTFKVKHMVVATVQGRFTSFDGTVRYDPDDLAASSITATIDVASINTDNEARDEHLRSADFFDVESWPSMTFTSRTIENREGRLVAIGDLTMRDVTREIELPFELTGPVTGMRGETRYGVEARVRLDRQDFGVSWSRTLDSGGLVVSDMVEVEINLEILTRPGA